MGTQSSISYLCGFAHFIPLTFLLNFSASKLILLLKDNSKHLRDWPVNARFQGSITIDLESAPQFSKTET